MIQAIIFDLDWVLVHSELTSFRLLQKIVNKHVFMLEDWMYGKRIGKRM